MVDVLSGHRTQSAVDHFLWMERVCVFGPNQFAHVRCPVTNDNDRCLLFRQRDAIWFRPPEKMNWHWNGQIQSGSQPVFAGGTVECGELRFRIEPAPG